MVSVVTQTQALGFFQTAPVILDLSELVKDSTMGCPRGLHAFVAARPLVLQAAQPCRAVCKERASHLQVI
jgi:hypothetical protein